MIQILISCLKYGLGGFVKVLIYPIKVFIKCVKLIKDGDFTKSFIATLYLVGVLLVYCLPLIYFLYSFKISDLINLGGTISILTGEGLVEYDGPTSFNDYGNGGTTGGGSFGGGNYVIDLDNLPDKVDLPSNYYQAGTVRQRAELLLLVQEICSRPEIDLRPEELLGLFYTEQNARFYTENSIILETEPSVQDPHGSVGPMQHILSSFESSDMYEIKGRTFISKMENKDLDDSKRVLTREQSTGLKTPDGFSRPNACYYPDAFYSAALRISNYKKGIYNNVVYQRTKPVFDWINSGELSEEEKYWVSLQQAYSTYNSYNSKCCGTWVPQMYVDIYRQHGAIDSWSDLATSNVALLKKFSGEHTNGIPYNEGAGLVGSTDIVVNAPMKSPDTYSTYTEYWHSLRHNVHSPHNYLFWAINGGTWVYEGLCALGYAVGTKPEEGGGTDGNFDGTDLDGYICPLNFDKYVVTSRFHEDRGYPHRGVDIDTGTGDPIYSPRDGVVTEARWDTASANGTKPKGGGKMVYVKFDNGVLCKVMHLSEWNVKKGDKVKQGDILGYTGNTGGSDGDHLHTELWDGDKEFDPTFLFQGKPITFLN